MASLLYGYTVCLVTQIIYDCWIENSIVTVDRRNGRDQVTMREDEFSKKYVNINTRKEIVNFVSKQNINLVKSTKRIATKTFGEIQTIVESTGATVSRGSILNFRSFFVLKPTERKTVFKR